MPNVRLATIGPAGSLAASALVRFALENQSAKVAAFAD